MSEDKSWAIGMPQEVFFHEFQRRNPGTDVIPLVSEWLKAEEPKYHGIPDLPPDAHTEDGPLPEEKPKPKLACRGCGKEFDIAVARAGHERHCKSLVKDKKEETKEVA